MAILVVIGYSASNKQSTEKGPIKIGVVFPMTGNNAAYSEKFMRGLNLAQDEINAEGGVNGQRIEQKAYPLIKNCISAMEVICRR